MKQNSLDQFLKTWKEMKTVKVSDEAENDDDDEDDREDEKVNFLFLTYTVFFICLSFLLEYSLFYFMIIFEYDLLRGD